jgi:Homeodomain-like domain
MTIADEIEQFRARTNPELRTAQAELREAERAAEFGSVANMAAPVTLRKQRAAQMLAAGAGASRVCQTLGIARSTLWTWRQDPAFKKEVEDRVASSTPYLKQQLLHLLRTAMKSLEEAMVESDDPAKLAIRIVTAGHLWKQLESLQEDECATPETSPESPHTPVPDPHARSTQADAPCAPSNTIEQNRALSNTAPEPVQPEKPRNPTEKSGKIAFERSQSNTHKHARAAVQKAAQEVVDRRIGYYKVNARPD